MNKINLDKSYFCMKIKEEEEEEEVHVFEFLTNQWNSFIFSMMIYSNQQITNLCKKLDLYRLLLLSALFHLMYGWD